MKNLKTKTFKNLNISFLSFVVALVLSALAPNNLKADEPIYRLYNSEIPDHLYTASFEEVKKLCNKDGWVCEGIAWYAPSSTSGLAVYRLYNPNGKQHFYTTNLKEEESLLKRGWLREGILCYSSDNKTVPVYRAHNPNGGEHLFTADKQEYDRVVKAGWKGEGIAFYATKKG
jgi:hypothetical protein